jgi:hypothetical protein
MSSFKLVSNSSLASFVVFVVLSFQLYVAPTLYLFLPIGSINILEFMI